MKKGILTILLTIIVLGFSGCGETTRLDKYENKLEDVKKALDYQDIEYEVNYKKDLDEEIEGLEYKKLNNFTKYLKKQLLIKDYYKSVRLPAIINSQRKIYLPDYEINDTIEHIEEIAKNKIEISGHEYVYIFLNLLESSVFHIERKNEEEAKKNKEKFYKENTPKETTSK
ncbi:hypothetical protein CRV02_13035 [Arcobacter sp. CECT 8989]|uniref:hypothetical protein n=1 Tax=Arcobacter sp. CECT 8989 TaxID=2044509 RepID=UPI00100C27B8|nr:hypothetical protein [Arcobacter sp. CECT 8989]RXJ98670.1 hypothetical protein CRV02_13035 [Arcobacter sp. CECT 8989]